MLMTDYLTDNLGFGLEKRLALNDAVLDGSRSFRYNLNVFIRLSCRDIFYDMLESVHSPFPECIKTLAESTLVRGLWGGC